jgi:UDP-N-acetylmuramate dehydrogenase
MVIYLEIEKYGIVYQNKDLFAYNMQKIHSICDYLIVVDNIVKLTNLVAYLNKNEIKYLVIGNGSNIVLPKRYNGVVIKLNFKTIEYQKNKVIAGASYSLSELSKEIINHNLTGLEWAFANHESLGGAVICNIEELKKYIEEIEVLENNKVKILKKSDIYFENNNASLNKRDLIILKVALNFKKF